ncbi:hypothetical protein SDC9_159421 [bioreactor metagenome]|uniref:Uncharacterized protein n=1 Tax=bioreactor metagenome TaxID=1076179 RepID=A0A645FFI3_9ZZZZ
MECLSGRIGSIAGGIQDDAGGDHTEDREEQYVAHDTGGSDAGQRRSGDLFDVFRAGVSAVEQLVRAGVGDVATDRSADDRGDSGEVDGVRPDRLAQRLADRGARDDRDVQRQTDHQETEKDDNPVDDHSGALVEEDGDGEECRDQATDLRVHAQQ